MWFKMAPSDLAFVMTAAERIEASGVLPAPPARVFEVLAEPSTWPKWFHDMRDTRWTSTETARVGAVRMATLGMGRFEERFIAWEPGVRFTFSIEGASVPLAKRVVEDWRLTAVPEGTRLDWAMVVDPTLLSRFLRPVLEPLMQRMFRKSSAGLTKYLRG